MKRNEMDNTMKTEALKALQKLLELSTRQPINEDGTPNIISSVDINEGAVDSWFRKSSFTRVRGWLRMLISMQFIQDEKLIKKIEAFEKMIDSDDFSDRKPTTQVQVNQGYSLVREVVAYLQKV